MLGSLRARLIVSFTLVVALAVFLAGAGALFLLRDKQQETARERYGRLAEPLNERVARLLGGGESLDKVKDELRGRATDYGVRILLLDQDLQVAFDSKDDGLAGKYVLSFAGERVKSAQSDGISYKWSDFDGEGTLARRGRPAVEVEQLGDDVSPAEAAEPCRREDHGIQIAFGHACEPRVDIAADVDDLEVGTAPTQLCRATW